MSDLSDRNGHQSAPRRPRLRPMQDGPFSYVPASGGAQNAELVDARGECDRIGVADPALPLRWVEDDAVLRPEPPAERLQRASVSAT